MADEDDISLDEGGSDAAVSSDKGGSKGGLIPMLLKWVAIGLVGAILIFVIVWFTGSFIFDWGGGSIAAPVQEADEYAATQEDLDGYTSLETLKVRTVGENSIQVVVNIRLGYKKDDKTASAEISSKLVLIEDYMRRYFRGRTASELLPEKEDAIRIEIRNAINDNILVRSKIKDVRFKQFDTIQ